MVCVFYTLDAIYLMQIFRHAVAYARVQNRYIIFKIFIPFRLKAFCGSMDGAGAPPRKMVKEI